MKKDKKEKIPLKLKTLVLDAIRRHAWNIGVSQYTGDVLYMEEDLQENPDVAAEITVNRRYLKMTLKIYPFTIKDWKEKGDEYMEGIIAHEIAHLATHHFYEVATSRYCDSGEMTDAWETLTQIIGQLSFKLDQRNKQLK